MSKVTELKKRFTDAEAKAHKLQAEKDDALAKVRSRFGDRLRKATDDAAAAQKAWLDAEAAESLKDRPDGEQVAQTLGLSLD